MWISRRRNKSLKREVGRRKRHHLRSESTEGKEETILTREKEETAEIIYLGETREEKDKTTEGRKEQIKVKNGEINKLGKVKEAKWRWTIKIPLSCQVLVIFFVLMMIRHLHCLLL
jgi:hypothetical protein